MAFLDANALIYLPEGVPPLATKVQTRLRAMTTTYGGRQLAISALSHLECRVGAAQVGRCQAAGRLRPDI